MSSPQSNEHKVDASWIGWFVGNKSNEFVCRVPIGFIEDKFNLTGLEYLKDTLNVVLEPSFDRSMAWVSGYEEKLYGMIHARYIMSARGVEDMRLKYEMGDFGSCPKFYCKGQKALPVGLSDEWGHSTVKIYCPSCKDVFRPRYRPKLDGAMFGTSFPHMFFMQLPMLRPQPPVEKYAPRLYGFRLHESALMPLESSEPSTETETETETETSTETETETEAIGSLPTSSPSSFPN
ncbi:suppressor-of-stellate-like protein [Drosophila mauritiana]|uniref:Suppressor-of-stellate-like protein n=1 Tax=Drosophila mauritiana TaxID=7226 RepID=A0A6P8KRK9_DROMA|nr:suppressor-of-stellate-like protein [Drosophila mauritiana]